MSVQIGVPCKWTDDGKQFILNNFDAIKDCPARIYYPIIILCPPSSWLHKHYTTKFSQKVKAVVGPPGWRTCMRTINHFTFVLAYWKSTIATDSWPTGDIIIFDALTGSQISVLSGHANAVRSLVFSLDGTLLVSGSVDKTVKLWDIQTGGVIKTLCGHTDTVCSVSISANSTMIASGSYDKTIHLWNIKTEDCHIIKQHETPNTVTFSPTNPKLLLSSSGNQSIQQWGIDGQQLGPPIPGDCATFSPDGTQLLVHSGDTVTIRDIDSRLAVMEFNSGVQDIRASCFFPNGRFIAGGSNYSQVIYLWDITGQKPHLIRTLVGHTDGISCLTFASSLTLVSASQDRSIKFWQVSALLGDQAALDPESIPLTSAPIRAVSLQAKDGLAFSIDSEGVVRTWDILTGCCKKSYQTQAKNIFCGDMQLIGSRLIIVGSDLFRGEIHVWDAEKGRLQTVKSIAFHLRIIGDGSRFLGVGIQSMQAWSTWTGESVCKRIVLEGNESHLVPLHMDDPKVFVYSGDLSVWGWDFGFPGSTPIQSSETSSDLPRLNFIHAKPWLQKGPVRVEDRVTGKEVFQLCGQYAKPSVSQWDGQYLITGYGPGEVLILNLRDALSW